LLRKRRLFRSIDHWPSAEMCFVAILLLGRTRRMSWCKISKSTIVAIWREEKNSSSYRGCKLLLSEDWFEVMRVDYGIASILPFRIDILLSSESIWFGSKITRSEPDDKVELREVLDHYTCLQINTLVVEKYSRFL